MHVRRRTGNGLGMDGEEAREREPNGKQTHKEVAAPAKWLFFLRLWGCTSDDGMGKL